MKTITALIIADVFLLGAIHIAVDNPRRHEAFDRHTAERLWRQKCFRCHDATLALRPVPPHAVDSLVSAMRAYDTLWINPHQAQIISQYMKRTFTNHNPLKPSQ